MFAAGNSAVLLSICVHRTVIANPVISDPANSLCIYAALCCFNHPRKSQSRPKQQKPLHSHSTPHPFVHPLAPCPSPPSAGGGGVTGQLQSKMQ